MGFVRATLFPALRLLVWAVIAVALCYLAFGRDGTSLPSGDALSPGLDESQRTVAVEPADIASTIALTGTVAADPASTVKATAAGVVSRVHHRVGDVVDSRTPLLDVRVTLEPVAGAPVTAPDGTVTTPEPRPRTRTVTVLAGSPGTLTSLAVLLDQEVTVGEDVATVSPGTLSVSAPLTQAQQFRLLAPPQSASAQARGGPAPFVCGGLSTAAATSSTTGTPDPSQAGPVEPSTAQVTCRVPLGTTVFAGMSVDLTIDTGSVRQVPSVPVTAVLGTVGEGKVWVVGADGAPVERTVRLGLTDGRRVQVTDGLQPGEQVLEFTLVASDDDPVPGQDGGVTYSGSVPASVVGSG